tara:strand:+ start:8302 stop:8853 length:552 start_codon:yes stop_codon:yes gene_type:complete
MSLKRLPGELTEQEELSSMIRVNHAGEYGAKRIYEGQLAALKGSSCVPTIKHMKDQEQVHLDYFSNELVNRRIRPTLLSPLWHAGGFLLGYATGFLGEKVAMACTVAVEDVIDQHYEEQEERLKTFKAPEQDLKNKIAQFRAEELEHKETGLHHGAEDTPGYKLLTTGIKNITKLAIFLSKRL